ncbi:Ref family recombination enhancement nuclease [Vibrio parahaemolyticus]|uniref:Ref family recombination enhancement nuclease n=1 Tax=Vibrio parahaemolyticus TaxID=670 RepID=UPI003D81A036
MALTIAQKQERQRVKQKEAMQRARDKQIAKMKDPAEKAKRLAKAKKKQDQRIAKICSPEYQEQQRKKALERAERAKAKQAAKPPAKRKATKGLKGRTALAEEQRVMDKIGTLPCIACLLHGRDNPIISLHHVFGRTRIDAHKFVLPLCCWHHDTLPEKEQREQYPDLLPVHAKGKYGGKKQFSEHNGTELELLVKVYEMLGLSLEPLRQFDIIIPN